MSTRRPGVLHLLAPAQFGGLERVVIGLVGGLASRGRRVGVAFLGPGREPHPVVSELERAGAVVAPISTPPRAYRRQLALLEEQIHLGQWSAIHSHGYHADFLAALSRGIARVTTLHGFTGGDLKNRLYEWLERRVVRRFSAVVAVSAPIAAAVSGHGLVPERLHLIRNAIPMDGGATLSRGEARAALGLDPTRPVVGWVGRLSLEKGPDLFVESIAKLAPGAVAVIVGDGALRASLERRAAEFGVSERIRWTGVVPNAAILLSAFEVIVLSSRTEGTPMVLLEAMRAGVPVVTTAVGGVPDVVGPEEAVLVAPDADQLAAAVEAVLSRPAEARARAERARRRFESEFDYSQWLDRYEQVYRAIGGL